MKLKRILALVCVFAMLLTLMACGKKKVEDPAETKEPETTTETVKTESPSKDEKAESAEDAVSDLVEGLSDEDIAALEDLIGGYAAEIPLEDLKIVSLTVSQLIDLGFTVDADLTQTLQPGAVSESIPVSKDDFTAEIQVSNPSTVEITLSAGVIAMCTISGETLTESTLFSTGIASLDTLLALYGDPYLQTAEEVVYQVYADERIDLSDVESLYEGYTGEPISENYKLIFSLAGSAISAISLSDPALLWAGLTGNIDEDDLEEMTYEEIVVATEVRDTIQEQLAAEFASAGLDVAVDELSGEILLSEDILFANNSSALSEDGQAYLDQVFAVYANVLLSDAFQGYVSKIVFEGHTSTIGSYDYNLTLSEERAAAVLDYCLNSETSELSEAQRTQLESLSETIGYSYTDPIFDENGEVDMDASRRVEIRFLLDPASFTVE